MRFRFRFESLLTYRAHRKERSEAALGRARQQLRQAREKKVELKNRFRETGEELRDLLKKERSAHLLRTYTDFLSELERKMNTQEMVIAHGEREVRDRVQEVLARTRETKIIEKLKERDREVWLYEQRRQEQKDLDEAAVVRHGRTPV